MMRGNVVNWLATFPQADTVEVNAGGPQLSTEDGSDQWYLYSVTNSVDGHLERYNEPASRNVRPRTLY